MAASLILLALFFWSMTMGDLPFESAETTVPSGKVDSQTEQQENSRVSRLTTEREKSEHSFFAAGQWLLTGYGFAAMGKTSREVYGGRVGFGYHFIEDFSLNVEGVGYLINQENDSGAVGIDLLPRWHYRRENNWSLYLDSGAGIIYSGKRLGHSGTHFNFTLQGGMGTTYQLSDRVVSMGGLRWFHISNARIKGKERNVGFDSPMFYLGIMMPLQTRN